jgi:hypothetical protein
MSQQDNVQETLDERELVGLLRLVQHVSSTGNSIAEEGRHEVLFALRAALQRFVGSDPGNKLGHRIFMALSSLNHFERRAADERQAALGMRDGGR